MTITGRCGPLLLIMLVGCDPQVTLDVILVDQCGEPSVFQKTESIRISVLDNAGLDESLELSGCTTQSRCLAGGQDLQPLTDFASLRAALQTQGTLFTAAPGPDQGLVISGFRDRGCRPDPNEPQPLTFCGYQIGAIPDEDAHLYMLLSCASGDLSKICWPSQFMSTCSHSP